MSNSPATRFSEPAISQSDATPLILVVDDQVKNIRLLQVILEPAGYAVMAASSGAMALQMAQARLPSLVLLDVMMPGMDGFAVCQRLKEIESTRQIPVIFITAGDDPQAESRGLALGAVDFVAKPINLAVLLARVKTHLALDSQRRSLEGMFRDVVEFAPDAFVFSDDRGLIVRVNRQTEQMFGYPRQALIGRPVELLIPPRPHLVQQAHRQAHAGRAPSSQSMGSSLICRRHDGSEFLADINLSPLQTQFGTLVMSVVRDVTEWHQTNQALAESRQHLRELYAQIEAVREVERKHMAREVHDELGQIMTVVRMDICLLEMRFAPLPAALTDKLHDMKALVDRAILGVRHVVANLRPTALDVGLIPALETLCADFARQTALPCDFATREDRLDLDEQRAVVVFRIVQESLTNIRRYAQASQVRVTLGCTGNMLGVEVQDNGCGFDPDTAALAKSFGLLGMHERAIALGGRVDIVSLPGQGTTVGVSIPLDAAQAGLPS